MLNKTTYFSKVILLFIAFGHASLIAESYTHTRVGIGSGRYAPYDKEELNRDEHDFKFGAIIDFEYGEKFKLNENFSFLLGAKAHYNLRKMEGTYTLNKHEPNAKIDAHVFGAYLTPGISMEVSKKFNLFLQANIGATFILWYQDDSYRDSFWVFYLPVDLGAEYKLKDDLSLTFGLNVQVPIYSSTAETVVLGLRKNF